MLKGTKGGAWLERFGLLGVGGTRGCWRVLD